MAAGRGALLVIGLTLLLDIGIAMVEGPRPLRVGFLHLPERRMQLEACLAALTAVVYLAFAGQRSFRIRVRVCIVILSAFAIMMANTRVMGSADAAPATFLPFAIVRNGSLTFEATNFQNGDFPVHQTPLPYYLVQAGGRIASKYMPTMGILALPFYLPAALGSFDPGSRAITDLEKLASAMLTALGVGCIYLALRRIVSERLAVASTAIYLIATPVLSILGQGLWQHTGAALGFSVGLVALTDTSHPRLRGLLMGLGLGIAIACRPPDVVIAAAFGLAMLRISPRSAAWMALTAMLPLLLALLYQRQLFGSFFATGYGAEASEGWSAFWPEGFAGLLVSPGRGLFVHSPVLLLAIAPLLSRAGRAALPAWFKPLALGALAFTCMMAKWGVWTGGYAAGNRMLSDTLPIFAVGLAFGLQGISQSRCLRRLMFAGLFASTLCIGLMTYVYPPLLVTARVLNLTGGPWSLESYPTLAYGLAALAPALEPPHW